MMGLSPLTVLLAAGWPLPGPELDDLHAVTSAGPPSWRPQIFGDMRVFPIYLQGGRLPLVFTGLATRLRHGASRAAARRHHPAIDGGQGLV
jgi:hypothetical protein